MSNECKICGSPAEYSHFGAISCPACRTFFKRNAEQGQKLLKCDFNGHCQINLNNRHVCSYCRLIKCFQSGMKIEMIRSSHSKKTKINRNKQFPTLNLLESDQSTLNIDQWNLLSNLSHCYDEYTGLSRIQNYIQKQINLPIKFRFKSASVIEMCQTSLNGIELLYKKNKDFLCLSKNDQTTLLHRTIKYIAAFSSNCISYHVGLLNYSSYYDTLELVTHSIVIDAAKRMEKHLDFDFIIMKLFLAIISFSTIGETFYSNTKQILDIQNKYIELTWKYFIYKYNYQQTIIRFSNFIRYLFALNDAIVSLLDIQWFTNTTDYIHENILSFHD